MKSKKIEAGFTKASINHKITLLSISSARLIDYILIYFKLKIKYFFQVGVLYG